MNKIILKEQKQSKEEKQENKKQKIKQKPKTIRVTKLVIEQRLLKHFQNHIGEEQKTTQEEIFQRVLGVNSFMVNSFSRFYFWDSIEKVIRKIRRKNQCFVIKKKGNYFVLKNENEAEYYKKVCDKAIDGLNKAQVRADDWVENESWKRFANEKYDEYEEDKEVEEEEKEPKTPTEIREDIDDKVESAKTKVVKLWKGEN